MKKIFFSVILVLVLLISCKMRDIEVINMDRSQYIKVNELSQGKNFEDMDMAQPQQENKDYTIEPTIDAMTQKSDEKQEYIGPQVSGVTAQMQKAAFWIDLYKKPYEIILTTDQIRKYNEDNFNRLPFLSDLVNEPGIISGDEVLKWINQLSVVPRATRYFENGKVYQNSDYQIMAWNINPKGIPDEVRVRYGVTVKRTQMRTWPSTNASFSSPTNQKVDYFTETAVYPGEPVSIYHASEDGMWYFAGIYHYKAWIPAEDVALCSKDELIELMAYDDLIVISGAKLYTQATDDSRVSYLQLDMGVSLPLEDSCEQGCTVRYPVRNKNGSLEYIPLYLPMWADISTGYINFTPAAVLEQAFKLIGEPYGWGGMNNARDCTSFLVDIYRTFGIRLPRNSNQQEQVLGAISLKGKDREERVKIIEGLKPGSLLYMPGHAMMYLGKYEDRHYIIHDVSSVYEKGQGGSLKPVTLYQVAVTPLEAYNSKGVEYIMALTTVVDFESLSFNN
jgi:uncharacterized protein YxeA